jgi:hypothetical protein
MKKYFLIILLCIPGFIYSQRFEGGFLAGFNASQIDGDRMGGYNKAGIMAGAFVTTKFQNKWGGQLEIEYSVKGSASSVRGVEKIRYRLQYIDIPVLITYDLNKKIMFQGGVILGYLFSSQQSIGYGYEDIGPVDKYAVSASLGGSYLLLDNLSINARYSYSIIPIYASYPGATGSFAWYNNVVSFTFNYRIGGRRY